MIRFYRRKTRHILLFIWQTVQRVIRLQKIEIIGETNLTLKVWHDNVRQRGIVSGILADIKKICRSIEHTEHYAWNMQRPTQRILPDNTTKQPLLMGILEVAFKFS